MEIKVEIENKTVPHSV